MTELVLAHVDLARIRFAHSPVRELVASLGVLRDPGRQYMYGTWLSAVRGRLDGVWLELLTALAPAWSTPPFVAPPPTGPWAVLADELDAIAATPPATVRADLDDVYRDRPLPAVLRPLHDDPDRHLTTVVQELDRYWQAAVHPVWRQLRGLCTADVAYRMDRFAAGGLVRVLEDLHPELSLDRDRLHIDKPHRRRASFDLDGKGIVLLPCAFSWPTLVVGCCDSDQPTLTYPTRGVAELCQESPAEQADPLAALVGRTRATLLATLRLPRSTTQLAAQLDLSPAAVSQHLKILRDSALVSARRRGRMVLYQRTPAASALLAAIQFDYAAG